MIYNEFVVYGAALILSLVLGRIFQKWFIKQNLIDKINSRSSHTVRATRTGGITIFATIFIISTAHYLFNYEIFDFSIIIPLLLLMVIGLYDDIYTVDFKLKFIFQIIAAKILIDNGLVLENLHGVFGIYELNRVIAQLLTIFLIVAIINSINFIDGIDGLALSVVSIFILLFEFFSASTSPFLVMSQILIFSFLPLYYFNLRTNEKVFLGDSGSLFLGGIVSAYVIYILSNNYIIKPEFDLHKILFVLTILIYPIVDIIRICFKRIGSGKSPFEADKNHIHHILLNKTNHHLKTTLIIVLCSLAFLIIIQLIF